MVLEKPTIHGSPAGKLPEPCSPFGVVGGINILNSSEENSVALTGGVTYSGVPGGTFSIVSSLATGKPSTLALD